MKSSFPPTAPVERDFYKLFDKFHFRLIYFGRSYHESKSIDLRLEQQNQDVPRGKDITKRAKNNVTRKVLV